jgi:isopentenyldiphosphate isomerase
VHILVFNRRGELFLQKRSMKKDLNKGLWDTSAAGHIDLDESYRLGAQRELEEELGVHVVAEALTFLYKLSPLPELGMEFIEVYHCQHDGPFVLATEEIDEGAWFQVDDINQHVQAEDATLTETFRIIWRRFLESEFFEFKYKQNKKEQSESEFLV